MNTILGGMFASRINMNLREEHGYTYGANSQFSFWRSGGPFSVATGVRTDVTAPAVHEVMLELRKMSETRVTPQELTLAKDAITLQLPALFETSDRVATSLSTLFTHGLPLNYYSNLAEQISVVDAQAVQDVAKKYVVPDKFVVVAVGDRSKIAESLEKELGTQGGNQGCRRRAREVIARLEVLGSEFWVLVPNPNLEPAPRTQNLEPI